MDFYNISVVPSGDKDSKGVTVLINGDLTLQNSEDIKQELSSIISKYIKITIKSDNIENIDISYIQLLFSIYFYQKKLSIDLDIDIKLNDELESLVKHSGFGRILLS
jgi:anti-anti-sigma regulatory factor